MPHCKRGRHLLSCDVSVPRACTTFPDCRRWTVVETDTREKTDPERPPSPVFSRLGGGGTFGGGEGRGLSEVPLHKTWRGSRGFINNGEWGFNSLHGMD